MIGYIENPRIVSSFKNKSKPYGKIQNRATSGFIFRISGGAEYIVDGKSYPVSEGEMIFLPEGLSYEYVIEDRDNLYTSINFLGDIERPEVGVYAMKDFYKLGFVHQSFSEAWRFGSGADRYTCMSVFYDLLSYIANADSVNDGERSKHALIEPAVDYMKKYIYDPSFRVERLHIQCGVSDTYFRRIFKERFGLSPKEYVAEQRISHARAIIESGDFGSIAEVAEMVGYNDPLYFSKAFKSVYGINPSGMIAQLFKS